MKICAAGGGNIAHAFIGEMGNTENEIRVLTRQPKKWSDKIDVYYDNKFHHQAKIDKITDDPCVLSDIDILMISIPANARLGYFEKIKNYINENTFIITAPSIGGVNFLLEKYFPKNKYACFQRTPYISRTIEYGKSVNSEVKKEIDAYFSKNTTLDDIKNLKSLFNMDLKKLDTFWTLFLSNSNPILHIVAMCTLLKGDYPYNKMPYLYDKGWNDETSLLALNMDSELEKIMKTLNVKEFRPLLKHYGVKDYKELTSKLKSIQSFKTLLCPFKKIEEKYFIDENSRYILEDVPFGTCFIKLLGILLNIKTPYTDSTIRELQGFMNIELVNKNGDFDVDLWQKIIGFDIYSILKANCKGYINV